MLQTEDHPIKTIMDLSCLLRRAMEQEMEEFKLSSIQSRILGFLWYKRNHHEKAFQKELESEFKIRRSSVTSVIQGLEKHGKEFVSMDPWARGAVDAIYDYGVDYKLLSESGVGAVCIQAREENWGHRGGEWLYVWEAGEIVSFVTSRAYAPDLHLYWAIATCNAPEHWIVVKDMPNAIGFSF